MAGSQIIPIEGKGQFPVITKLFRLIGKEVCVLTDLDGFTDDNNIINLFAVLPEATEIANDYGNGDLQSMIRDIKTKIDELVQSQKENMVMICEPATSRFKLSLLQRYRHKIISLDPSISITFFAKKPSLYIRLIRKRNSFNFTLFNSGVSGEICLGNASFLKNTKLHNSDAVFNSIISAEWVEIIIVLLYLFAALFISRRRYDCNCGCKDTSGSSINNTSTTSSNRVY